MDTIIRTGRSGPRRAVRQRIARALSYLAIFLGVLCLIAGAIYGYAHIRFLRTGTSVDGLQPKVPAEPMNVLVLGSDTREVLTDEQQKSFGSVPGKRADTIILLHIDEEKQKAVLVHFPRDLRIRDPGGSPGKLNAVYGRGPDAMVQEIKEITSLPVHHYVEVDFNGFNRIVDELGGVRVQFERPIKDPLSGLDVPKGCVNMKGRQALSFVRLRQIDDDFGRIERQQLFVKLVMDEILDPSTLVNVPRLVGLVNAFAGNIKHDAELKIGDVRQIAARLKRFDSANVDMRVVPSSGQRIRGVSYVVANQRQADALFSAMRNGDSLPPFGRTGVSPLAPADVNVSVLNGTSVDKLAQSESSVLAGKGFKVTGTGGASPHPQTTVYFREGYGDHAGLVAAAYGAPTKPLPASLGVVGDVALVLGKDFASGQRGEPNPSRAKSPPAPPAKPLVRPCDAKRGTAA